MNIECYAYKNSKNVTISPFLEYLEKYAIKEKDLAKNKERKIKKLMNIKAHLDYLMMNNGKYNLPPHVQKYRNQSIAILKIKEGDKLVRIAFFTVVEEKIIILDALDKPSLYEKLHSKKVNKRIEDFLFQVEKYRIDYLDNKQSISLEI